MSSLFDQDDQEVPISLQYLIDYFAPLSQCVQNPDFGVKLVIYGLDDKSETKILVRIWMNFQNLKRMCTEDAKRFGNFLRDAFKPFLEIVAKHPKPLGSLGPLGPLGSNQTIFEFIDSELQKMCGQTLGGILEKIDGL